MAEEFRAYGEALDNVKMEELNEEQRDEEKSYQHHGASTYHTNPLPAFLRTYNGCHRVSLVDSSFRHHIIVLSLVFPPSLRIRIGLY